MEKRIKKVKHNNILIKIEQRVAKKVNGVFTNPEKTAYYEAEIVLVGDKVEDTDVVVGAKGMVYAQALAHPIDIPFEGKEKGYDYFLIFADNLEIYVETSV